MFSVNVFGIACFSDDRLHSGRGNVVISVRQHKTGARRQDTDSVTPFVLPEKSGYRKVRVRQVEVAEIPFKASFDSSWFLTA
jgi:hypothetical protein